MAAPSCWSGVAGPNEEEEEEEQGEMLGARAGMSRMSLVVAAGMLPSSASALSVLLLMTCSYNVMSLSLTTPSNTI